MMGDTYAKIAEIKNEWMRQVIVEQDQEGEENDQSGELLDATSGHQLIWSWWLRDSAYALYWRQAE